MPSHTLQPILLTLTALSILTQSSRACFLTGNKVPMDGTPLFPSPSVQPLMPVGRDERLVGVVDVFGDFFSEARLYDAYRVLSIVNISL